MTTVLEETTTQSAAEAAVDRMRQTTTAVRLAFTWFGVRKALSTEQKSQAADAFNAQGDYISAGKKLLDTRHRLFRAVTRVKNHATAFWRAQTLPFPEAGVRLIRQDRIEGFTGRMEEFQEELQRAVAQLEQHYAEMRAAAARRLGSLFDPADYPEHLQGLFLIDWDFPSVQPPEHLMVLHPDLYRREAERVAGRFDDAVQMAEAAFAEELTRLVSHLAERLSGETDGRPKVFRDSAIGNLTEFFHRFRDLNVRSNAELDELVERAEQVIQGVAPQRLRDDGSLRVTIAQQINDVRSHLDELLIDRPRRRILRRPR